MSGFFFGNNIASNTSITSTYTSSPPTARTLADRFSDVFNVKDFGAKGDSSTDDQPAIQAAINALIASGCRGEVYFPPAQVIAGDQKYYLVNSPIDLTWLKTASGLASVVIRGCGEASKVLGTFSGFIFQKGNTRYDNYEDAGILVIEKLSINNTSTAARSGAILIASNTGCAIRDCHIGGQNGIALNNGAAQDHTGVVTSVSAPRTLNFSGGFTGLPAAPNDTLFYVFDQTTSGVIPAGTRVASHTGDSPSATTQIVLNADMTGAGVQVGDTIGAGNTGLFVFTAVVENCILQGKGKSTATGIGIACCQGMTINGCDITGFAVGIGCYAGGNTILGGRLEVNATGILSGVDLDGNGISGNTDVTIIGTTFESNNVSIDFSQHGVTGATIQSVGIATPDGLGVDGIKLRTDSGTKIGIFNASLSGGWSGYGIRCPWTSTNPANRTFIGVRVTNTTDETKNFEMPSKAFGGTFINCNNPDAIYTYANLPSGNDSTTGQPLNRVGDTYWISDGKASNCTDTTCTTWNTAVTGGSGALKLKVTWNDTGWVLSQYQP